MRYFKCGCCGYLGLECEFKYGKGREYGQHPEHRYCPRCGSSIDWYGYGIFLKGELDHGAGSKNSAFIRQTAG